MRREFARIGVDAETLADAVDLALQRVEIGRSGGAGIDRMRLPRPEGADARQRQREGRPADAVERVGDLVGDMAFDIADEAQRHVVVFDVDPAGSGQAAAQQGKRKRGVTRNFEGGEKTRHGQAPFLESYS